MKREIVLIAFIIIAVSFAGCTGSDTPASPGQLTKTVTTYSPTPVPSVTTKQQPDPVVSVKMTTKPVPVKIFTGDFHRVEYRNSISVTMPPNPPYTWERRVDIVRSSSTYKGLPAVLYETTIIQDYGECCTDNIVTTTKDGLTIVDTRYFDSSSDRFLGGTETSTIKGELQPGVEVPDFHQAREDKPGGFLGIEPFGEMNISLAFKGSEPVTVPAGTYSARKYSGEFQDGTPITFWVAASVPVPVRVRVSR